MITSVLLCLALLAGAATAASEDNVSGTWDFTVQMDSGTGNPVFTFQQEGEKLTGEYRGLLGQAKLTGSVKGGKIEFGFEADYQGQKVKVTYKGSIEGAAAMKGTTDYAGAMQGAWTAKKR